MSSQPIPLVQNDRVLAKAPGECCRVGVLHEGTARGELIQVAGVETYISRPPADCAYQGPPRIMLYFPDVWGLFNNGKLVMDAFANGGYTVLGLDYFCGDWIQHYRINNVPDPNFDFDKWKRPHVEFADKNVPAWVEACTEEFGSPGGKVAAVGYCFGAPYIMNQLVAGGLIDAGAFAHPAFLNEQHFDLCTKPLFMSTCDLDHTFSSEARERARQILSKNECTYHLQVFSGIKHGFALRGDMSNRYERWVKEESLNGILSWFELQLAEQ